ncbi:MAG: LytTR family DNA-binding domain-containing protein [Bacteroidia bacterium]|nr:LytTR family DNA-binding domain-containing protein [Bacteroidia bacterium]
MNILIVEDEALLAEELEEKLLHINSSYNIVAKLQEVDEAVEWLNNNSCDLIFMDIQLSDGLSFSIFDKIQITTPVIFTTAYDQYAIRAFDVNSIAYILKPVEEAEIKKALSKYDLLKHSYIGNLQKLIAEIQPQKPSYKEQLILTHGTVKKIVNVNEISYFQADDRYVFAFTTFAKRLFCDSTLRDLEDTLNSDLFFRINRTFIVRKDEIDEWHPYSKGRIKIHLKHKSSEELIVSRARSQQFKLWLRN